MTGNTKPSEASQFVRLPLRALRLAVFLVLQKELRSRTPEERAAVGFLESWW